MASPPAPAVPAEKTFTSYTAEQGATYAKNRPHYHPNLYKSILDYHTSTGGQLTTLLDIGCGPGTATRALASSFAHAIGLDPSAGMIASARALGGASANSVPIRFELSGAEDLGSHLSPPIAEASVDLLVAATAAHWFDMARFWPAAARVLVPGGTVALWTTGSISIDPRMPNADKIQAAMDEIETRELLPFFEPGNLLTRDLYATMPLPWTLEESVRAFEEKSFVRREWGAENSEEFFMGGSLTVNLDVMEMVVGTASPVQRWREAHPDAVGTERDVVKLTRGEIERLLHEAGVEKGKEMVQGVLKGVLLMVKKKV